MRPQIIEAARDFVKTKVSAKENLMSVVLSEDYTITLVDELRDSQGRAKDALISINKANGQIILTKKLLEMSDQSVFFWIIWAVYWLEDDSRNKRATDENAFRLMLIRYPPPHIDFVIEFGNIIDGEPDSSGRVNALMRIMELRQNSKRK